MTEWNLKIGFFGLNGSLHTSTVVWKSKKLIVKGFYWKNRHFLQPYSSCFFTKKVRIHNISKTKKLNNSFSGMFRYKSSTFWVNLSLNEEVAPCYISVIWAQFIWKSPDPYNPYLYPYNEFAHFWWQKCGCRWSMVQSHMPKSVPSCLIILSNQPIFHYQMRLMYQIFILLVYHYFTRKTCCHVKLLGFSAINCSGLLDLKVQTESMAEGADISIKKCMTRKHLSICLVLMNLMQNIPVSGRVVEFSIKN